MKSKMPEPASVRSEEFINAFDYRDPEPAPGVPIAFAWERARYPFAHNRDLLRFSGDGSLIADGGAALNSRFGHNREGQVPFARGRVRVGREETGERIGSMQLGYRIE